MNEFTKWRHNLTGFFEIAVDRAVNNLRMDMYEKFKEVDDDLEVLFARVGVLEVTMDRVEKKIDNLEQRLSTLEQKVDGLTGLVTLIAQALNVTIPDKLRQGNNG